MSSVCSTFMIAVAGALISGGASGVLVEDTSEWILNVNTSAEPGGETSLDDSGSNTESRWDGGAFPVPGKKYLVRQSRLRAPLKTSGAGTEWRFAGETLAIDGGSIAFLGTSLEYNIEDFRWYSGKIENWSTSGAIVFRGNILLNDFTLSVGTINCDIWSVVTSLNDSAILVLDAQNKNAEIPATVRFRGDTSRMYGTVSLTKNTVLAVAGDMPASVTAESSTVVTSIGAEPGEGASYKAVTLASGASLTVPGTDLVSVGDLTVNAGSHLVWDMAAEGSFGTLVVTNLLALSGTDKIRIEIGEASFVQNDGEYYDLLRIPAGAVYSENDIELVSPEVSCGLPIVYDMKFLTEGRDKVVRVKVRRLVRHLFSDRNAHIEDGTTYWSSMTNAASWSDNRLPHENSVYQVPGNADGSAWFLRTPENATIMPNFPGDALVLENGTWLALRSSLNVKRLVAKAGSFIYMTDKQNVSLTGKIFLPEDRVSAVAINAYNSRWGRKHTLSAELSGGGVLKFEGRNGSGAPGGIVAMTGLNTNFNGRVVVTIGSNPSVGNPGLDRAFHQCLCVSDPRNLGGRRSEFTYDALRLEQMCELNVTDNMTIEAESFCGVFVLWNGMITVDPAKTLTLNTPITYAGCLRKGGAGVLALGAKPRFVDGAELTDPTPGTNELYVAEGGLMALTSDCLDGVAVKFASGTEWVVPASQTGEFALRGVVNTRGFGGVSADASDGMIDVLFTGYDEAEEPTIDVALCTLARVTEAELLVRKLRFCKPYKGARVVPEVRLNDDNSATILLHVSKSGLVLVVR